MFDLSTGKLFVRKRSTVDWLVLFIIVFPFFFGFLFGLLGVPDFLKFLIDGVLFFLTAVLIIKRETSVNKRLMPFMVFVVCFFLYTFVTYTLNFQSFFYYFWGLRNNFRMYLAFMVFGLFLTKRDADDFLRFFDIMYWINFVVCLVQFFVFGYEQDYLGGVFGTDRGCNGYINIFICIVIAKSIIYFINKKESIWGLLSKIVSALILCGISELKFFIVELIVIVLVASLINKFSWRKLLIIAIALIGAVFGVILIIQLFPEFVEFFSLETMFLSASSESGYTSSDDLNRLTAIPIINSQILTNNFQRIFGLGLGNCDLSSIDIFNTPFYESHSNLNYNWFSYAFMYMETGYVGMTVFYAFYILCFVLSHNRLNKELADKEFCQMSMVMSVLCCIIAVYGGSLRTDAAYMAYFILALPFINYTPNKVDNPLMA